MKTAEVVNRWVSSIVEIILTPFSGSALNCLRFESGIPCKCIRKIAFFPKIPHNVKFCDHID